MRLLVFAVLATCAALTSSRSLIDRETREGVWFSIFVLLCHKDKSAFLFQKRIEWIVLFCFVLFLLFARCWNRTSGRATCWSVEARWTSLRDKNESLQPNSEGCALHVLFCSEKIPLYMKLADFFWSFLIWLCHKKERIFKSLYSFW